MLLLKWSEPLPRPLSEYTLLRFLRLEEGESIAALLFAIDVLALALDYAFFRRAHWPPCKQGGRGLPVSLAALGVFYMAASLFITGEFFHLLHLGPNLTDWEGP